MPSVRACEFEVVNGNQRGKDTHFWPRSPLPTPRVTLTFRHKGASVTPVSPVTAHINEDPACSVDCKGTRLSDTASGTAVEKAG